MPRCREPECVKTPDLVLILEVWSCRRSDETAQVPNTIETVQYPREDCRQTCWELNDFESDVRLPSKSHQQQMDCEVDLMFF